VRGCGFEIATGFGQRAILEHYEENFAERLEREKKAAPKGDPQFRVERSARVMRLQWLYSPAKKLIGIGLLFGKSQLRVAQSAEQLTEGRYQCTESSCDPALIQQSDLVARPDRPPLSLVVCLQSRFSPGYLLTTVRNKRQIGIVFTCKETLRLYDRGRAIP